MTDILTNGFAQFNTELTNTQIKQFEIYGDFLVEYNEKVNLTAITEPEEIYVKHFLDSGSLLSALEIAKGAKVIDVGTGAGFPGMVLKILRPDLKITLLDSLNKRIEFLRQLSEKLNITDGIEFVHSRAEDAANNKLYREKFDVATSRAVANMSTLSEYCLPYVKIGGCFAPLKGPASQEEISAAANAIKILGGGNVRTKQIKLYNSDLSHVVILVDKMGKTPHQYPRNGSKPSKQPLK